MRYLRKYRICLSGISLLVLSSSGCTTVEPAEVAELRTTVAKKELYFSPALLAPTPLPVMVTHDAQGAYQQANIINSRTLIECGKKHADLVYEIRLKQEAIGENAP